MYFSESFLKGSPTIDCGRQDTIEVRTDAGNVHVPHSKKTMVTEDCYNLLFTGFA